MKSGTINELLDMLTFAVGIGAIKTWMSLADQEENAQTGSGVGKDLVSAMLNQGLKVGKQINSNKDFGLTLETNWSALEAEGCQLTGLKRAYTQATMKKVFDKQVAKIAVFTVKFLSVNGKSPLTVGSNLFTLKSQWRLLKSIAKEISDASSIKELNQVFNKFQNLMGGKGKSTKRLVTWAKSLALLGSQAVQSLSDEVDAAQKEIDAGKELGEAKRKYAQTDSDDPDGRLNAEIELSEAEINAENVINESDDPEGAKARIITQAVQMQEDKGFGVNPITGYAYKTKFGAKGGLNEEQERFLLLRGKVLCAAGAGSGKTQSLAYLIEQWLTPKANGGLGYQTWNLLCSSFTRNAAAEIFRRVQEKTDVNFSGEGLPRGFGTVHRLTATNFTKEERKKGLNPFDRPKGGAYAGDSNASKYFLDKVMILAYKQVQMSGGSANPVPRNLFIDKQYEVDQEKFKKGMKKLEDAKASQAEEKKYTETIHNALKLIHSHHAGVVNQADGRYWGRGNPSKKNNWYALSNSALQTLERLLNPKFQRVDWKRLPNGKKFPSFVFSYSPMYQIDDQVDPDDVGAINQALSTAPKFNSGEWPLIRSVRLANIDDDTEQKTEKFKTFNVDTHKWANSPAEQWFNIGYDLESAYMPEDAADTPTEEDRKQAMAACISDMRGKLMKLKGKGLSSEQCWHKVGEAEDVNVISAYDPASAFYGAYEWLLGNTDEVPHDADMTDIIIDAVRTLINNPKALKRLQRKYKVILVDEAQDLNRIQHMFFGLIAGTVDPQTLEEKPEGDMTAHLYAMIGDDKQAIYGFQGADSGAMIEKADVKGGDFKTNILTANYRSGRDIVRMANQFIAHNEDRIPMTCEARNPARGIGNIRLWETVASDSRSAQDKTADKVTEEIIDKVSKDENAYRDFGVAVRSNAEGEIYAIKLLSKGVPYEGKFNPLAKKEFKGVLSWFKLARYFVKGKSAISDNLIYDLTRYPKGVYSKGLSDFLSGYSDPIDAILKKEYQKNDQLYKTKSGKSVSANGKAMDQLRNNIMAVKGWVRKNKHNLYSKDFYDFIMGSVATKSVTKPNPQDPTGQDKITETQYSFAGGLRGSGGNCIFQDIADETAKSSTAMEKLKKDGGIVTQESLKGYAVNSLSAMSSLTSIGSKAGKPGQPDIEKGTVFDLLDFSDRVDGTIKQPKQGQAKMDAVRVMTAHGWKGLEADQMYVPVGSNWARSDKTTNYKIAQIEQIKQDKIQRDGMTEEDAEEYVRDFRVRRAEMESERRLMYVALTRAETGLTVIHNVVKTKAFSSPNTFFANGELCLPPPMNKTSSLTENWGDFMLWDQDWE